MDELITVLRRAGLYGLLCSALSLLACEDTELMAAGSGVPGASDALSEDTAFDAKGSADATASDAGSTDAAAPDSGPTGGTPPDALGAWDAAAPDVFGDANEPPLWGIEGGVLVYELDAPSAEYNRGNALARFGLPEDGDGGAGAIGPCAIREQAPGQGSQPKPSLDAGFVRVTGTSQTIELLRSPEPPYAYASNLPDSNPEILGSAGTIVTVTGTGGLDVPAFSGEVPTPAPVKIEAPALGLTNTVSTSEALAVSWVPAEATSMVVSVMPVGLDLEPVTGLAVYCTLPGDPGKFTVPKDAMQQLPSSFGTRLVVSVTRAQSVTIDAGGVPVTLAITTTRAGIANAK